MAKTFDLKIQELEQEKSELDLTFLENKKQEYTEKMYEILDNQNDEIDEKKAIDELNKVKSYRSKIKETENRIQNNSVFLEDIDKKISSIKERRERVRNIPLYRDTEEWIIEVLWDDTLYQYAQEIKDKKLIEKFEKRKLTEAEYDKHIGYMYRDLQKKKKEAEESKQNEELKQTKKQTIVLPEWMSDKIKEELKSNKDVNASDVEDFLKKELKKNAWEIKTSHIKNRFWSNSAFVTAFLKLLTKSYPIFKIVEDPEKNNETKKTTKSKNDKLISSISTNKSEEHKNERLRKNNLLFKLDEIWKLGDLKSRVSKYCDLFEELDCKFTDREDFEPLIFDVISKYTHIDIEKEIIKTLNWLIQWNFHIEKTWLYKYNVYRFNRDSRRMLAYPNWEIFGIYPHEEYEKIINTQPPVDKIE